jgi:hypothetical protein
MLRMEDKEVQVAVAPGKAGALLGDLLTGGLGEMCRSRDRPASQAYPLHLAPNRPAKKDSSNPAYQQRCSTSGLPKESTHTVRKS